MRAEKIKIDHVLELEDDCLTLPLSSSYITHTFGPQAVQVCSGQSIVIVNPNENKVYKCPLMYDARDALELICGQPA